MKRTNEDINLLPNKKPFQSNESSVEDSQGQINPYTTNQVPLPNYTIPKDGEGYSISFNYDNLDEAKKYFDDYGFVVINNILTIDECEKTVNEIFEILEAESNFVRDNPNTWDSWPESAIEHYGNFQKAPIFTKQFLYNRMNEKLYNACVKIIGDSELLVNHDRGCLFRPTKDVPTEDGNKDIRKWKTSANLHLDVNPWDYISNSTEGQDVLNTLTYDKMNHYINENNYPIQSEEISIQGGINLLDNKEEDGGFVTVPCFHKYFNEYFNTPKKNKKCSYSFHRKDLIQPHVQRVSMRQGSIVIWDQRMAHGSYPNQSNRMRASQFFRMFKKSTVSKHRAYKRSKSIKYRLDRSIPDTITITEHGKKVLGLASDAPDVYGLDILKTGER